MITYIKGEITTIHTGYIHLESYGIGYHINISLYTYGQVKELKQTKLFTYLHITENKHSLYGFSTEEEKEIFVRLISVSGIGPNTGIVTLSYMEPNEVKRAIVHEDHMAFHKVKGVGPKTAKRIILDLKDKIIKELGDVPTVINRPDDTLRREATAALQALGLQKQKIDKQISAILKADPTIDKVEELIKMILKQIS